MTRRMTPSAESPCRPAGAPGTCRLLLLMMLAVFFGLVLAGCQDADTPVKVDFAKRGEPERVEPPQAITYAYLPQYAHRVSLARHHLLVEYLAKATGLRFRQVFPDTFDNHIKMAGHGKIDISFVNPFVYVRMHRLYRTEAFAKVLEYPAGPARDQAKPSDTFRGQVIVRADNEGVKTLGDSRGKRWIAVDPSSAGGYLYPLGLFIQNGISPSDFSEIAFAPGPGGKQEKVIMAVLAGKYDLGTIREGALDVITGSADVRNIRVLAETPAYPGWVYCARAGLDPAVLEKIKAALIALDRADPEMRRILDHAEMAGIVPAVDADYDPVRELIKTIGPAAE